MKSLKFILAVGIVLIATSLRLHAQSGCEDSPENATAILGLVGSLATFCAYARRRYLAGRSNNNAKS